MSAAALFAYRSPRPILVRAPGGGRVESPAGRDSSRPGTAPPAAPGTYRFGARTGPVPVLAALSGKSAPPEALQAGDVADALRHPWGARIGDAKLIGK